MSENLTDGDRYCVAGEFSKAFQWFTDQIRQCSVENDPNCDDNRVVELMNLYIGLAKASSGIGNHRKAAECYKACTKHLEDGYEKTLFYIRSATIYFKIRDYYESVQCYKESIESIRRISQNQLLDSYYQGNTMLLDSQPLNSTEATDASTLSAVAVAGVASCQMYLQSKPKHIAEAVNNILISLQYFEPLVGSWLTANSSRPLSTVASNLDMVKHMLHGFDVLIDCFAALSRFTIEEQQTVFSTTPSLDAYCWNECNTCLDRSIQWCEALLLSHTSNGQQNANQLEKNPSKKRSFEDSIRKRRSANYLMKSDLLEKRQIQSQWSRNKSNSFISKIFASHPLSFIGTSTYPNSLQNKTFASRFDAIHAFSSLAWREYLAVGEKEKAVEILKRHGNRCMVWGGIAAFDALDRMRNVETIPSRNGTETVHEGEEVDVEEVAGAGYEVWTKLGNHLQSQFHETDLMDSMHRGADWTASSMNQKQFDAIVAYYNAGLCGLMGDTNQNWILPRRSMEIAQSICRSMNRDYTVCHPIGFYLMSGDVAYHLAQIYLRCPDTCSPHDALNEALSALDAYTKEKETLDTDSSIGASRPHSLIDLSDVGVTLEQRIKLSTSLIGLCKSISNRIDASRSSDRFTTDLKDSSNRKISETEEVLRSTSLGPCFDQPVDVDYKAAKLLLESQKLELKTTTSNKKGYDFDSGNKKVDPMVNKVWKSYIDTDYNLIIAYTLVATITAFLFAIIVSIYS